MLPASGTPKAKSGPGLPAPAEPATLVESATLAESGALALLDEPASLLLAAAGDVNLGRRCGQRLLSDPTYDPFRGVAAQWADADVRFVNLEAPLSEQRGQTQSPHNALVFTGPPGGADALARAGVNLVSTANNHAWDYGVRGLEETLQNLDRVKIAHAGTGSNEAEAYRPAIVHANGLSLALFAVTQVWNLGVFRKETARHHVAWADAARLREAVRRARADADFVVVSFHGGEEYVDVPLPRAQAFIEEMLDLGVDAVLGHHPHVLQGIAWHDTRPVFHSLGNFLFDTRKDVPATRVSFIAKLRFRRARGVAVLACPIVIDGYEPRALAQGDRAARQAFLQQLRALSAGARGTTIGEPDAQGCLPLSAAARR